MRLETPWTCPRCEKNFITPSDMEPELVAELKRAEESPAETEQWFHDETVKQAQAEHQAVCQ